jgi:hypothetical protein
MTIVIDRSCYRSVPLLVCRSELAFIILEEPQSAFEDFKQLLVALCRVTARLESRNTRFLFGNDPVRFEDVPDGYHMRVF